MPSLWSFVCKEYGASEPILVTAIASAVHAASLWFPCLFFAVLEHWGLCSDYRIQRRPPPRDEKLAKKMFVAHSFRTLCAFWEQVLGTLVVVPAAVYALYPLLQARGVPICDEEVPSAWNLALHISGMLVGCDFLFYWVHRSLHASAWLYRNIHKKHHAFISTNIWASEYFGVIDMILNILPGVLPAVALRSHFVSLMIFTALRGWQTVQSHAGYALPFDPLNRGIFANGAARHDFHHSHNVGCFGDWTPFWDWLCGTDRAFKAHWDKIKDKKEGRKE